MHDKLALGSLIEGIAAKTGFSGEIRYHEPMSSHTSFKVGGPADLWIRPAGDYFPVFTAALLDLVRSEGVPLFVLGGGANLVVADRGIRGIVLDTAGWTGCSFSGEGGAFGSGGSPGNGGGSALGVAVVRAGTAVDDVTEAAAGEGWGGLEFLAGMPGTMGGAVWMNARCYGKQVSDVLVAAEILDERLNRVWVPREGGGFSYKRSPFQNRRVVILAARFALERRETEDIRREMGEYRRDREEKGHYRYPSAGSVFKNNRDFGKPTGKVIDELGLRGFSLGGARVAPWHGNIIINTGNASAGDIRNLTERIAEKVKAGSGYELEPEILFVGEWDA